VKNCCSLLNRHGVGGRIFAVFQSIKIMAIPTRLIELINLSDSLQRENNRLKQERDEEKRKAEEAQQLLFDLTQKHKALMASYGDIFQVARKANSVINALGASPILIPQRRAAEK